MIPPAVSSRPLSAVEYRWLAEVVRRHEARHGRLDDAAVLDEARRGAPDLEDRICRRAELLDVRAGAGWRDAILRWHARARLALVAAGVLAGVLGVGTAAAVLGDGSRPVNVVWALGGLLGVHLLSLALWVAGMVFSGRQPRGAGAIGAAWMRLVAWFDRSPAGGALAPALGGLLARSRLASYGLGVVSHLLWLFALVGAAAGVLALLAGRRYGFVWETTILPADPFVALTTALGTVPAWLGFPVPDAAMVLAIGEAGTSGEAARRAWSGWLLGCVLVYGVLPRLALTIVCALLWRAGSRALRLDLTLPEYLRLRHALLPESERIGVRDPAPAAMAQPRRHALNHPAPGAATMVALELGDDLPWPPAAAASLAVDGGRLDSREQRRSVLARLAAAPPARLLIAIDPRQTPDRGSLGLIAELADRAGDTRLWALPLADARSARVGLWRESLARLELPGEALLQDEAAVSAWLEAGA